MMPYLYSMAGWAHFKDYTLMRALVMDFTNDTKVNDIKDQWMFGPSLMACPVGYFKTLMAFGQLILCTVTREEN